jgi:adenylate cyclase class 2
MTEPTPTETELKIPVPGLEPVRNRLEALAAAHRNHPSLREVNILLDSAAGELEASGSVLRLRSIGERRVLTLKGPPRFEGAVKHREELELEVTDIELMSAILDRLGFAPVLRYEKDRESWRVEEVTVTLDHTPMGDFVELEGPADRLEALASELGVDPHAAVRGSYVELWAEHRTAHPGRGLPVDMVFGP